MPTHPRTTADDSPQDIDFSQLEGFPRSDPPPHFCLGAPLARLEAALAIPTVFKRYPELTLAVDPAELVRVPSMFSNSSATLPVRLGA